MVGGFYLVEGWFSLNCDESRGGGGEGSKEGVSKNVEISSSAYWMKNIINLINYD